MTTLKTVVETQPALQSLSLLKFRKASQGFKLATYMRKFGEHFSTYEKQRVELLKEYGTEKDGGRSYQVTNEKLPAFTAALDDMLSVEVDGLVPPTISLSEDLKEESEFSPWELYPLWGNVIEKVNTLSPEQIALTRNEVLILTSGVRSLGAVKIKNLQLAYKILNLLAVLTPVIDKFQEEESAITGTPEEKGAAMQALYQADAVEYSLYKFTLDELEGLEIEPAILLQLEKIISV